MKPNASQFNWPVSWARMAMEKHQLICPWAKYYLFSQTGGCVNFLLHTASRGHCAVSRVYFLCQALRIWQGLSKELYTGLQNQVNHAGGWRTFKKTCQGSMEVAGNIMSGLLTVLSNCTYKSIFIINSSHEFFSWRYRMLIGIQWKSNQQTQCQFDPLYIKMNFYQWLFSLAAFFLYFTSKWILVAVCRCHNNKVPSGQFVCKWHWAWPDILAYTTGPGCHGNAQLLHE